MIFGEHIGNNGEPDLYIRYEPDDTREEKIIAGIHFRKLYKKIDSIQKKRLKGSKQ